jgi:hypothetical protein
MPAIIGVHIESMKVNEVVWEKSVEAVVVRCDCSESCLHEEKCEVFKIS